MSEQEPLPHSMTLRVYAYWAQGERTLDDLYDDLCIPSRYSDEVDALWEGLEKFKAENPDLDGAWYLPSEFEI